jgi:hypothetical protein
MNRTTAVMNMHWRNKTSWLFTPVLILGSSFLVNIVVAKLIDETDKFYSGGITSIFIYMLVIGSVSLVQTFPFALGLSVRRTDYFLGTAITAFINCLLIAIMLCLLAYLEADVTNGWWVQLHFFNLPYVNDGNPFQQLVIYLMIMFNLFFLGFVISSIYRRFGIIGMIIGSILILAAGTVGSFALNRFELWDNIFAAIRTLTAFQVALWLIPFTACYAIVSYLLLRRSTV